MNIYLYTFSKRKNSTKVPAGAGTTVSCRLKDDTSILRPSFELVTNPTISNYVKWGNNYYYIVDCTSVRNGVWRIDCRMDALATFASQIKTTSAFIEYTDSYDARIFDPRLAKKINATELSESASAAYVDETGYYAVTVLGTNTCGCYVLSENGVVNLMNNAAQWWNSWNGYGWSSVEDSIKNLGALFMTGNPAENIKSCKFIPADAPHGTSRNIYAGFYDTGVTGKLISYPVCKIGTISVSIPHPANVMLRTSGTCEYNLYIPFIGNISLSADILADESTLTIRWSVHCATGDLACTIETGSGKYVGTYGGNMACDVPIGSAGIGVRSVANSIITAGAGIAHAGAAVASVGAESGIGAGIAAGITKAVPSAIAGINQLQGTATSVGGLGSTAGLGVQHANVVLTCSYWELSTSGSNLTSLIGNPYYKVDSIGNHGYVKCSGASIDIASYDEVINEINSYLGAGIYVE